MTKEFATCIWETLEITKASDTSNPLVFESEAVELDSKRLYIPKWRIKPKDLTSIQLEGDNTRPSSVVLTIATNEITARLIHVQNDAQWNKFLKRLEGFVKRSDVTWQKPSSSPLEKNKFESGKVPTTRPDTLSFLKSTGNSPFSPSRPGRRQQTKNRQFTSPARTGRTRGTFGKKPKLTPTKSPIVEWSDNESDDLIVHPSPVQNGKKRDMPLYLSDDDQVQMEPNDEDKVMIGSDDEEEYESLFDNVPSGKAKRKVIDDSDDDQDFSVIGKLSTSVPSTTTTSTPPRTQNRVSPASRTQEKVGESPPRQMPLNKFFAPKTALVVSSFDPTKRADKISTTPLRMSTNSFKKSNHSKRSGGWLQRSKAGSMSPLKERQKMLFGSTKKGATTPKKDDDPVEEYPSPSFPAKRDPLDVLDQHPFQKRLDFATTTGAAHKRKRPFSNAFATPPRRLSLDAAAPTKPDESALVLRSPWRGLRNLGNTCYLNSSIQMLVALAGTTTGATNNWWDGLRGKGGPLTKSLIDVVDQLMVPPRIGLTSAVTPSQVKNAIDAISDKFAGYEQRDAHEFLSDLIDSVHEELDKDSGGESALGAPHHESSPNPASPTGDDKNEAAKKTPLPTDDFRLTVEVCLSCESCGYERKKTEIYRHLSVDIMSDNGTQMGSITNGLNHFFESEVLEIRCEKCAQGSHAKRSLRILSRYVYPGSWLSCSLYWYFFLTSFASSPKYLLLHLKRFIFTERPVPTGNENAPPNSPSSRPQMEYILKKNQAPVELVEDLSLEAFCANPPSQGYKLRGLVHHVGNRASSGHYTADSLRPYRAIPKLKDTTDPVQPSASSSVSTATSAMTDKPTATESCPPQEEWIMFDDGNSCKTSLKKIQQSSFKQQNAYMLLYSLET
eukprot:scaffold9322_cov168-Amphora_coffeaeformis.AAC.12